MGFLQKIFNLLVGPWAKAPSAKIKPKTICKISIKKNAAGIINTGVIGLVIENNSAYSQNPANDNWPLVMNAWPHPPKGGDPPPVTIVGVAPSPGIPFVPD
jgi:hypothetical protein